MLGQLVGLDLKDKNNLCIFKF